jgi:hypothetical protein
MLDQERAVELLEKLRRAVPIAVDLVHVVDGADLQEETTVVDSVRKPLERALDSVRTPKVALDEAPSRRATLPKSTGCTVPLHRRSWQALLASGNVAVLLYQAVVVRRRTASVRLSHPQLNLSPQDSVLEGTE